MFRRLARELGIRPNVMHSPLTITDVRAAAGGLLARPDAPTAVITNSDYTALGIYLTARDLSLRIGPDVSVIGHDDLPTSELLDPPLATIRLDGREMGRAFGTGCSTGTRLTTTSPRWNWSNGPPSRPRRPRSKSRRPRSKSRRPRSKSRRPRSKSRRSWCRAYPRYPVRQLDNGS